MNVLTKKEFEELTKIEFTSCVSFFIPTHRRGVEVGKKQDQLVFKNQIKAVQEKLSQRGWEKKNIKEFLHPANELLKDKFFWRNQTEGLAIFLTHTYFNFFNLPFEVSDYFHIGQNFYLRPLVPSLVGSGDFYALSLNLHQISFYKGDRERLKEIPVDDLIPQRIEEVIGYDYKEKSLQFRTQKGNNKEAVFHGHGTWKGEFKKEEILKYFREVDKKITSLIHDKNIPLVIIGSDHHFSIYQKANTYPSILDIHMNINPKQINIKELHEKIWRQLYPLFDKVRIEKVKLFHYFNNTTRVSYDIQNILLAAIEGKIDTLFVRKGSEEWGILDKENNRVVIEDEQTESNISLINLAVTETIKNGGNVYEQIAETMPMPYVKLNAFYRF